MRHITFHFFHCIFFLNHILTTSTLSCPVRVVNNLLLIYDESHSTVDTKI